MILTDEAASERLGYTFNTRNSAFEYLKEFISYAQIQWGEFRKIKDWRMDGVTEYAPNQIQNLCSELGQRIELSTSYAPWHDGRAEYYIRIIIEKVKKQ